MFKSAILIAVSAIIAVTAEEHNINDCIDPGNNPAVLYDQEVSKNGHIFQIEEEIIRIPLAGFSPGPISCITVVNLFKEIDGGYPTIKSGGVGYNYVDIYLKSQRSKGFDFRIIVYYNR